MTRDELIERVAEAIHKERNGFGCMAWARTQAVYKDAYRSDARASINTIFAALKEPTEEMTVNGYVHCYKPLSTWQAMLNASPLAPKGE